MFIYIDSIDPNKTRSDLVFAVCICFQNGVSITKP